MLAVLLPAINFRGNRSPYLWWFHKLLSELGEQAGYICGDDYFREPSELFAEGRLEANDNLARLFQYRLPDRHALGRQTRADIPLEVWQALEARYPGNPLAAFKHYCLEEDPLLREAFATVLGQLEAHVGPLEAVITCVNCASLQALCRDKNLPLIHVELGPLRQPAYLQTAYFDFSGVNGGTEARSRFAAFDSGMENSGEWHSLAALRTLFMMQQIPREPLQAADLGLCLQVEDDSNILCYANGHSALSLINDARQLLSDRSIAPPVLVRPHPGSHFSLRNLPSGLEPDPSATSLEFILRCKRIHTINSGLAVEALLQDRVVSVRGDCPFSHCIEPASGLCNSVALSFFLLNYLVPWNLAFTPAYIRWRLGRPTEAEIRQLHLESFMQEKIKLLEARVSELEQSLADRDHQLNEIRSSFAWRMTFPQRAISKLWRRLFGPRHP